MVVSKIKSQYVREYHLYLKTRMYDIDCAIPESIIDP